jgi:predicted ATP-grasp superfamily ATP-dependent carboligase
MLLQEFVPGDALSATFLVGPHGAIVLVGIGRQRIERSDRAFAYLGGSLPLPPQLACEGPLQAIRAVDGLRGLVGVDFIRDPRTGRSAVLEVNPRPTTSVVGLLSLLPAGRLARAWLDLFGEPGKGTASECEGCGIIPLDRGRTVDFEPNGATRIRGAFDE